ncbi:hypothetical protein [Comamonas aquatica]|uniref:hypothetical protein n=1 Tax=Comamonas aquatica TaxID=225991 RepID=UPI0031D05C26
MRFTVKDGQIYGYDESQQALYDSRIAHEGHESISEADALAILNPSKPLQELASAAMVQVNAEYTKRMGAIAEVYPLHERESWPVQLQEANLLLSYADVAPIPETVKTPWIDQCAHQRGMDRMELAARIVAKDEGYRTASGFLSGVRQWHEDCIDLLLQEGEGARDELQAYDHQQGWERAEEQLAT